MSRDFTGPTVGEQDPAEYEALQRQRKIERHIRRWKLREAVALTDQEKRYARARVGMWQQEQRRHVSAHSFLSRRYDREKLRIEVKDADAERITQAQQFDKKWRSYQRSPEKMKQYIGEARFPDFGGHTPKGFTIAGVDLSGMTVDTEGFMEHILFGLRDTPAKKITEVGVHGKYLGDGHVFGMVPKTSTKTWFPQGMKPKEIEAAAKHVFEHPTHFRAETVGVGKTKVSIVGEHKEVTYQAVYHLVDDGAVKISTFHPLAGEGVVKCRRSGRYSKVTTFDKSKWEEVK
ncbi:hypothetical protein QVA66_09160 [Staphylococcus chromogenes]|nr:hypothetical protein [Staphylococcus chromogenes]